MRHRRLLERAELALSRRHIRQAEQLAGRLVRENPEDPRGVALLARAVATRGQIQRALRLLRQAGAHQDPDLMIEMARLLATSGRLDDARDAYLHGLRLRPQSTVAWLELAEVMQQQGDPDGAAEALVQAIRGDPLGQDGYLKLGEMLEKARAWNRAVEVYRDGLRAIPRSPELLCRLGAAQLSMGEVDDAISSLGDSLALKPVNDAALYKLGSALLERGDFEAAERRFEQLLKLRPQLAEAWFKLVHCRRQNERSRPALERLAALSCRPGIAESDRARLLFALGKAYDDLSEFDQAFRAVDAANVIRRELVAYKPVYMARLTDELIDTFQPCLTVRMAGDARRGRGMVFIAGLPRSGCTLVDQILGAHSRIASLGDNDRLTRLKTRLAAQLGDGPVGYPQAIGRLDPASLDSLARRYLRELPVRAPVITDRALSNYLNLGLIRTLFPAARVVHVTRDPRDTCLSMYFSDLGHRHGYAFSLDHLIDHYRDYQRLMNHWQGLWGKQMQTLRYESLVNDFDDALAGLMAFVGLPVDPACTAFHRRRNPVATESSWQVRQPLHNRSVGRWRNYHRHLGPLLGLDSAPRR